MIAIESEDPDCHSDLETLIGECNRTLIKLNNDSSNQGDDFQII